MEGGRGTLLGPVLGAIGVAWAQTLFSERFPSEWTYAQGLLFIVVVGILSFTHPEDFAKPSVWSSFGIGYGFIPLVLPVIGLWWLIRVGRRVRGAETPAVR